jgi:hypothetical protein
MLRRRTGMCARRSATFSYLEIYFFGSFLLVQGGNTLWILNLDWIWQPYGYR